MDCVHRTVRIVNGSGGRTRTATGFTPTDFESVVSTNFTTPPSESGRIILSLNLKATGRGVKISYRLSQLQTIKQREPGDLRKRLLGGL